MALRRSSGEDTLRRTQRLFLSYELFLRSPLALSGTTCVLVLRACCCCQRHLRGGISAVAVIPRSLPMLASHGISGIHF